MRAGAPQSRRAPPQLTFRPTQSEACARGAPATVGLLRNAEGIRSIRPHETLPRIIRRFRASPRSKRASTRSPSGRPRTTSRPSRRCSARSSSTMNCSTACRASLQPNHFFEPLHGRLFEVMAKLIGAGKHASPITLKTFFDERAAHRRADGSAISRPSRRRRHHHHQRSCLWPRDLRPRRAPRADRHRRGHGERRLRFARRRAARDADRVGRVAALRPRRQGQIRLGLHGVRRRHRRRHRDGRARL